MILIEADLRRPAIGRALNVKPVNGGVVSVLLESVALEDALVTPKPYEQLGLLLADYEGGWITELFALDAAARLIEEARELADWVIVDSPPLTEVVDALPLARLVDSVLIVTRLGSSRLSAIRRLGELLAENGIKPVGFAVVGTGKPTRSGYYYVGKAPTSRATRDAAQPRRRRRLARPRAKSWPPDSISIPGPCRPSPGCWRSCSGSPPGSSLSSRSPPPSRSPSSSS